MWWRDYQQTGAQDSLVSGETLHRGRRRSRGLPGMWRVLLSRHNVRCYRPVVRIGLPCCQGATPGAGCWDASLSMEVTGARKKEPPTPSTGSGQASGGSCAPTAQTSATWRASRWAQTTSLPRGSRKQERNPDGNVQAKEAEPHGLKSSPEKGFRFFRTVVQCRAFRLPAPVVVREAGRRALSLVQAPL